MCTVMLADDNKFALAHFEKLVCWEDLGFSLVACAIDGFEAWDLFCKYSPDVVITDVQMPGLNGIELAKKIKERCRDTVVVFLSSYDEFDYARSAIDLNVREYILKQELDKDLLEKKLLEIRGEMERIRESRDKFLNNQIRALFRADSEELEELCPADFENSRYDFIVLEQDHVPEFICQKSGFFQKEANYKILIPKIKEEVKNEIFLFRIEKYRWGCFMRKEHCIEKVGKYFQEILYEEFGLSFSIYLMGKSLSLWKCRQEYEKNRYIFEQRYFEGTRKYLSLDMYEYPEEYRMHGELNVVFEGEEEEISERIDMLFRPILYHYDFQCLKKQFMYLLEKIESVVPQDCMDEIYDDEILHLITAKRMIRWIKEKCVIAWEYMNRKSDSEDCILHIAEDFIEKEYGNPLLSVEDVAKKAKVSVNWLNDLFKKEHKETVGRFLTKIRMENSKKFLKSGDCKMGDIALKTGYNSASYWAKVFKKTYGISPQEYYEKAKRGSLQ